MYHYKPKSIKGGNLIWHVEDVVVVVWAGWIPSE